jgi:hypothetical protein
MWFARQNNYKRAKDAQEEALYIFFSTLGPHHQYVICAKDALDFYNEGSFTNVKF